MKCRAAALALMALACCRPAFAADDYVIDTVMPLTGPSAFVGAGGWDVLQALEVMVNRSGGIAGHKLHLVIHDDQSSPQVAVQLTTEAMASHPAVIFGSTITAMCNAQAALVPQGPVIYCFSPGIHPAAGAYSFSASISTLDLARALLRFFRLKGLTRLALMVSTDATGQDAERGIDEVMSLPENKSLTMVERGHFNPGDISVNAQIEGVKAARPQALIAWTTGTALATIFKAVVQTGLDIPVATTNGNMNIAQMTQYAEFEPKELYLPTGPYTRHDGVYKLDPRIEDAQRDFYAVLDERQLPLDNHGASPWDAAMIVVDALRKLGPDADAAKLRQYIATLKDYAGIWGIYDFPATPQRGIDEKYAVVTRWNLAQKRFDWASEPGGAPLGN